MFENMKNLEIVNAFHGTSVAVRTRYTQNAGHSFSFKTLGETVYTFDSGKYILHQNEISFLPSDSSYYSQRIGNKGSFSIITFQAEIDNPVPHIFSIDSPAETVVIFNKMVKLCRIETTVNRFEMLSLFYKLLALLTRSEGSDDTLSRKQLIEPAILYLENNLFNQNLEIGSLHTLCGISDTHFRNIFACEFGSSPQKYITEKRLSQAKYLLDMYEYRYIYEVAGAVGYNDSLYFSKVFKKRFGYSPSKNK